MNLQSLRQQTGMFYFPGMSDTTEMRKRLERKVEELNYFFSIEDTSATACRREDRLLTQETSRARSAVKALVWTAIAVAASIAMGQLL